MGICPLYYGKGKDGLIMFASELKALTENCQEIGIVMPGTYMNEKMEVTQWYQSPWLDINHYPTGKLDLSELRANLTAAVKE